jgi:hypothetical protein
MTDVWFKGIAPSRGKSAGFDISVANPARVYDCWLGGKDNFAADRKLAMEAMAANPEILAEVRTNRAFLGRAVRHLVAEAGVRQFLDIGTGMPTADNTHEVAQWTAPECRVVYVDNDPVVLTHARALLTSAPDGTIAYLEADVRDVDTILEQAKQTLDFTQPIAIMLLMVLHMIPDADDPYGIVTRLVEAVPSGSYLAISHPASDISAQLMADMAERLSRSGPEMTPRTNTQVSRFFTGLELLEPGVVALADWRPGPADVRPAVAPGWCGAARKA